MAGLLARGELGYGAPFETVMLAIDAEEQGEDGAHAPELICFTGERLRRPWRRGTSASMADRQGDNEKGQGERGLDRLLTRNSTEVAD